MVPVILQSAGAALSTTVCILVDWDYFLQADFLPNES